MTKGEKIYDNIKRLAYKKGMSVNALCKQAQVSRGMLGDFEHSRRDTLGQITIDKLTRVLECTPEDILSLKENNEAMPDAPKRDRSSFFIKQATEALEERQELRRLLRAAMKANKKQVDSTAALLESILDMRIADE